MKELSVSGLPVKEVVWTCEGVERYQKPSDRDPCREMIYALGFKVYRGSSASVAGAVT